MDNSFLKIKVILNSEQTKILEVLPDETIKIALKALPVKGQANDELIKFLSKKFNVHKDNIKIISGKTTRLKLVKIKK